MAGNKGRWYLVRWSEMTTSKINKAPISKTCRKVTDMYLGIERKYKKQTNFYFSKIMTGMFCDEHLWVTSHRWTCKSLSIVAEDYGYVRNVQYW